MATLDVRVKPRASNDRVTVAPDGTVSVAIAAPPVDGQANDRLVRVVARALNMPRSAVSIAHGAHGRHKVVDIEGMDRETALNRLRACRS